MISILGTGLSGLVGSRVSALLSDKYGFTNLSKETGFDIMDFPAMEKMIADSPASWVFHFAAFTDVGGAEKEKNLGVDSSSWKLNVNATDVIARACRTSGKRLLYISTDYVFDGTKAGYQEDDTPNPISWYGRTKFEGEEKVKVLGDRALIVRIANPYRAHPVGKKDFLHKMKERLEEGLPIKAPNDQRFSATFIDDIAFALDTLVSTNSSGYYHVVGKTGLSPFEAAQTIVSVFGLDPSLVTSTTYEAFFTGRALPPRLGELKHDKIDALGVTLHTFEEGVREVKKQEEQSV